MPGYHTKKKPYAQNPYGGQYATQNRSEYMLNMPKQGFKSGEQLNKEIVDEHNARTKGNTLVTSGLTY